VARLGKISMTPVKGMALIRLVEVELTPHGIPGNRRFYLIDEGGELFSGFDHGPLVAIVPRYDQVRDHLSLRFPDGTTVEGPADLPGPSVTTNFHGRPVHGYVVEGPWSERISAYADERLQLVRTVREGEGTDVEHLTIVSAASVADLATRGKHEGPLDSGRFRMDLELEDTEPFEEDTWERRQVAIGTARVTVLGQIPRCRVTTQSPSTGRRDWNTLTQIARYRPRIPEGGGIPFGMYARVVEPATVRVGDPVSLLPDSSIKPASGVS
jgi:uncharacterized protein YcbX